MDGIALTEGICDLGEIIVAESLCDWGRRAVSLLQNVTKGKQMCRPFKFKQAVDYSFLLSVSALLGSFVTFRPIFLEPKAFTYKPCPAVSRFCRT
jgi:hypothetical protein